MNELLKNLQNENEDDAVKANQTAAVNQILGNQVVDSGTGAPTEKEQIETVDTIDAAPESDVLEVTFATRRGGGMTLPLEVPGEGVFVVDFKAGAVTLYGRAALAMREEYQRNEHLRRLVTEVASSDKDLIMRLNKEATHETQRAHRGVGSATMGRTENAAHQRQLDRRSQISAITNTDKGNKSNALQQLGG
jgi:hypothetical protein